MNSRSRSLRRRTRGLFVAGAVAFGLSLGFEASIPAHAQQLPPRVPSPDRPNQPPAAPTPKSRLLAQQLATRKARAAYEIARSTRELAEIAVEEYAEGIYLQDLATVEGEIKLAESDLMRGEDRRVWARRMFDKGFVSMATKVSEELNFKKAQFTLEQAQSKKKVLEEYTKAKTIKERKSEVKKARADELDKKVAWKQAEALEAELERQLERN
jgi:HlyD family secretion protein